MAGKKSFKREVAGGLLILWTLLVLNVFWFTHDAAVLIAKGSILTGLTMWIVPPALLVFGFHAHINKGDE